MLYDNYDDISSAVGDWKIQHIDYIRTGSLVLETLTPSENINWSKQFINIKKLLNLGC